MCMTMIRVVVGHEKTGSMGAQHSIESNLLRAVKFLVFHGQLVCHRNIGNDYISIKHILRRPGFNNFLCPTLKGRGAYCCWCGSRQCWCDVFLCPRYLMN